jgi:hypothetical protein
MDKILQRKEIAKIGVSQLSELKKRIKKGHIPIDAVEPEDIYSFLRISPIDKRIEK